VDQKQRTAAAALRPSRKRKRKRASSRSTSTGSYIYIYMKHVAPHGISGPKSRRRAVPHPTRRHAASRRLALGIGGHHFMYNESLELTRSTTHRRKGLQRRSKKYHPNFCRRITIFRVESARMALIACCGITCTTQSFFREKRHRLLVCCPNPRFNTLPTKRRRRPGLWAPVSCARQHCRQIYRKIKPP
jgi:hypothetical protein